MWVVACARGCGVTLADLEVMIGGPLDPLSSHLDCALEGTLMTTPQLSLMSLKPPRQAVKISVFLVS